MPLIIPPATLERLIYTTGDDYNVNDLIELKGIHYRVKNAIVNAPQYADYDNLEPIGLGMGHATYREYNTNIGTDNWLHICDIPVYFSGIVSVAGEFPAKQVSVNMRITTSYKIASITGDYSVYDANSIKEIKLLQNADGAVWTLWINVAQEANLWQMHMVANGSGNSPIIVRNNAFSTATHPGNGSQQYYFNALLGKTSGSFDSISVPVDDGIGAWIGGSFLNSRKGTLRTRTENYGKTVRLQVNINMAGGSFGAGDVGTITAAHRPANMQALVFLGAQKDYSDARYARFVIAQGTGTVRITEAYGGNSQDFRAEYTWAD